MRQASAAAEKTAGERSQGPRSVQPAAVKEPGADALGNLAMQRLLRAGAQTKLAVSQPG